jgi:hypothetical protein
MTIQETNVVTPLRPAKAKRADDTAALRQRRSRGKRKSGAAIRAPIAQVSQPEKPSGFKADVTVSRPTGHAVDVTAVTPSRCTNYAPRMASFCLASGSTFGTP